MNFVNAVVLWKRQHWGRGLEIFMPSILKILDLLLSHTKKLQTHLFSTLANHPDATTTYINLCRNLPTGKDYSPLRT
jgi:hypothetical protein